MLCQFKSYQNIRLRLLRTNIHYSFWHLLYTVHILYSKFWSKLEVNSSRIASCFFIRIPVSTIETRQNTVGFEFLTFQIWLFYNLICILFFEHHELYSLRGNKMSFYRLFAVTDCLCFCISNEICGRRHTRYLILAVHLIPRSTLRLH